MAWRETTVSFDKTLKDDGTPLGLMKIKVRETHWNITIIFESETPTYSDALLLPVNTVTKAITDHLLESDLILGATEDIGPLSVEAYRIKLISVAHQLSFKAGIESILSEPE